MSSATAQNRVVLVIDDEVQIRRLLRITLEANGYKVLDAANGREGLVEAATRRPDIVILDLGLPDMDGVEVARRLREWSTAPIVVLSVRDRENDKIAALDAGADDYLTKPFGVGELLARIRVAMRHTAQISQDPGDPIFKTGDLQVDLARRQVLLGVAVDRASLPDVPRLVIGAGLDTYVPEPEVERLAEWLGAPYEPFGAHSHYGLLLGEQGYLQVADTLRAFLETHRL